MSITYRLAALAVVLGLFGLLGYDYHRIRGELATAREAAKTAQAAEKRTRAAVAYREQLRAATAAQSASAAASLEAAIRQNESWAEQAVPQEVQDALAP